MNWLSEAAAGVMAPGRNYGVNPVVFADIYIGAIPFFLFFTTAAVRRIRQGRAASLFIMAASLCFISAYLYLAINGHGIPVWVWCVLGGVVAYGGWSAVRNFRKKLHG